MTDDEIDLSPQASAVFWAVIALAVFAVTGFVAGVIYAW